MHCGAKPTVGSTAASCCSAIASDDYYCTCSTIPLVASSRLFLARKVGLCLHLTVTVLAVIPQERISTI